MKQKIYNPEIHHRRSIRIKEYDYSQEGLYFITICTSNHEKLFGYIDNGEMVLYGFGKTAYYEWLQTGEMRKNVVLQEFVIMPNHMHGIIEINDLNSRGTMLCAQAPHSTTNEVTWQRAQNDLVNQRQTQYLPLFEGLNQRLQNR